MGEKFKNSADKESLKSARNIKTFDWKSHVPCPRDFNLTFQLAQRIFSFQVSIILLLSEPKLNLKTENDSCKWKSLIIHSQGWKIPLLKSIGDLPKCKTNAKVEANAQSWGLIYTF